MYTEETLPILNSAIQTVIPEEFFAPLPEKQIVYLDFDGAVASYYNRDLDIFIDNVVVDDSGMGSTNIDYIVNALNTWFGDDIEFTSSQPLYECEFLEEIYYKSETTAALRGRPRFLPSVTFLDL